MSPYLETFTKPDYYENLDLGKVNDEAILEYSKTDLRKQSNNKE